MGMDMDMDMVKGGREERKWRAPCQADWGENQSPARPLQTCTPRCHPIPGPGRDVPGASGMKQFVESSSIQGRLSGLSRGLADRILVWLTEREGCGRRVASTSTQWAADEDYCTLYIYGVQYRLADGKGALRISI
jgi:hypothetical protein